MLKLSKIQSFLLGLAIIFLFYFLNRLNHIIGSEKVIGTFVFYIEEVVKEEKVSFPIIEYTIKDSTYQFRGRENTSYEINEKVPVLLERKNPDYPLLFSIQSFWLYPLFYWVLPVIIWAAFSLSYIHANEKVVINFKFPFLKKIKKE